MVIGPCCLEKLALPFASSSSPPPCWHGGELVITGSRVTGPWERRGARSDCQVVMPC